MASHKKLINPNSHAHKCKQTISLNLYIRAKLTETSQEYSYKFLRSNKDFDSHIRSNPFHKWHPKKKISMWDNFDTDVEKRNLLPIQADICIENRRTDLHTRLHSYKD